MNSWKSVLAGIVFAYLVIASAISLTVRHFAEIPPPRLGQQQSTRSEIVLSTVPECLTALYVLGATGLRSTSWANDYAAGFKKRPWDFSGSDEIPSYALLESCEEYGS